MTMPFDAKQIVDTITKLGMPPGSALIHASAAMVLHGLIKEARDIDVATNEAGWQHALTLGEARQGRIDQLVEPVPDVELFSGWLGEPLDGLFARARPVSGLLVAAPQDILDFKRKLNRPKDAPHIRLLEEHICNNL